jgi:hypothetical protein
MTAAFYYILGLVPYFLLGAVGGFLGESIVTWLQNRQKKSRGGVYPSTEPGTYGRVATSGYERLVGIQSTLENIEQLLREKRDKP